MQEKNPWPQVILTLGLTGMVLAALVVMAAMHVDTRVIFDAILALGLGGGLGVLVGVKNNVNGNLSKLVDHLASQSRDAMNKLAAAPPPDHKDGGY